MTRRLSRTLPRCAGLGALAVGLGLAAPADATCSGVQGTLSRPGNAHYVCRANCSAAGGYGYIIRTEYYDGMQPASTCMDECTRTPGCRAVSTEYGATRVDGSPGTHTICVMYRETDFDTIDHAPFPRVRNPAVCYRDFSLRYDPRVRIDTDQFRPDQYRPGVPGPSLPKKP